MSKPNGIGAGPNSFFLDEEEGLQIGVIFISPDKSAI